MSEQLVLLSALCALEAVPLRFNYFATFWRDVATSPADAKLEEMLLECSVVAEYVDSVLLDERESLADPAIYDFMQHYYPKLGGATSPCASGASSVAGGSGGSGAVGGSARAAEALAEELAGSAARAPLVTLVGSTRALLLMAERARPTAGSSLARALHRAATALHQRLLRPTVSIIEEETGEAEAGGPTNEARCPSADGSEGEEPLEESDESTEEVAPALPDLLPLLSHALRRLHQLQPPDD